MNQIEHLIPLREYCRKNKWPRLPQWQHWIHAKKTIALRCVKRVEGRYFIDLQELENFIKGASLINEDLN